MNDILNSNEDKKVSLNNNVNAGENGYWQDVHNKTMDSDSLKNEFHEDPFDVLSATKSRRDFLKIMGFSFTALPLASCLRIPVKKAVPYLHKNDTIVPGVANWYATSMGSFCGSQLLVKNREGRPIKVEGNDKSKYSRGGTSPYVQASLISLYDSYRLASPKLNNTKGEWAEFDKQLIAALKKAKADGKEIVLVTQSMKNPSLLTLINEFKSHYGSVTHIAYDAFSNSAQHEATKKTHGSEGWSELVIENADLIVGFEADFLSTYGMATVNTKQYADRRDVNLHKKIIRHVQVESQMSLTGSNADVRIPLSVSKQKKLLAALLLKLKNESITSSGLSVEEQSVVGDLAKELNKAKGRSIVCSGINDVRVQAVVNEINSVLENFGKTVNVYGSDYVKLANDAQFVELIKSVAEGKRQVGAILFSGVNPAYDFYDLKLFKSALEKIAVRVSFASSEDETSILCDYVGPDNNVFESWRDHIVSFDELSFSQPLIEPLVGSRMFAESLIALSEQTGTYYDYMKKFWEKTVYPLQNKYVGFVNFWDSSVHDGIAEVKGLVKELKFVSSAQAATSELLKEKTDESLTVQTYQKIAILDGKSANNPWLQELPDPITKATWGNYIQVSPKRAREMGVELGDVLKLTCENGYSIELPALVQPGLEYNSVAVAVGYGRTVCGKVGKDVGQNAFGFTSFNEGSFQYAGLNKVTSLSKTGKKEAVAQTQTHHSMEGRDIVRETTLSEYLKNPKAGNENKTKLISMWEPHEQKGHQWALSIDLNRCIGCSGCIISCSLENNVPVVGKQEVINRREMHWIRIDRYYKGDESNPEVVHQPLTCMHCENAPCESVCPVAATVHSSDGLNQQAYNRCVGTRYCANNCPYKVRRFNWFNYPHEDVNENLVLNPDIGVRSRGVMEKCSMCIQRIQEGKLVAAKEGRPLKDGDIKTACQQSCPGDAIAFGDMTDPNSKVNKYLGNDRNYKLLEEINVLPRVSYLTKVRNK